jgi:hypothetical protein
MKEMRVGRLHYFGLRRSPSQTLATMTENNSHIAKALLANLAKEKNDNKRCLQKNWRKSAAMVSIKSGKPFLMKKKSVNKRYLQKN